MQCFGQMRLVLFADVARGIDDSTVASLRLIQITCAMQGKR